MSVAEPMNSERGVKTAKPPVSMPALPKKKKTNLLVAVVAVVVLGGVVAGAGVWLSGGSGSGEAPTVLTYAVQPETFDVKIPLGGELKAIRNVEVRSMVEGQTTIVKLVAEGTRVKEDDVLVELSSEQIKDKLEDARIRLENANAAVVNAQESLTIQQMQNESDLKAAETNAELARLEFEQFDKGDAKVKIDTLKTALANAETDLERKTKDRKRVEELAAKGFVSDNDVLDAQIAERDSQNKLETAKMGLEVWLKYEEPRTRQAAQRKRDEAAAEFERVKRKTNAAIMLKEADLRARKLTQRVEETRFKYFTEQLAACTIKAPQPGMVIYQSSIGGGGQNQGAIEEGAVVRQNQVLIQLPDTSKMMVEVKVPEQLTDRIKTGQEVTLTVDAVPNRVFTGRVESISVLPDSRDRWMNPNIKEYPTQIVLDGENRQLKPGMSAKTEILLARLNDVVAVPVQAIFSSAGQPYVFVGTAEKWEKRPVKTGLASSARTEIVEGLRMGENVLLSRPKNAPEDPPATSTQRGPRRSRNGGERPAVMQGGAAPAGAQNGRTNG